MTSRNWSPLQSDIFNYIEHESRSLVIYAGAGSGKSTTIVHGLSLIPTWKSVIFLAFNKSIADELGARVPTNVQAMTFHKMCFGNYRRAFGRVIVDKDGSKTFDILKQILHNDRRQMEVYGKYVKRLIGYAKNAGIGVLVPNEVPEWQQLVWHYNLTPDSEALDESLAVAFSMEVLEISNQMTSLIDFDDMIYLTLLKGVVLDKFQYVIVDELQDLSGIQLELTKKVLGPGGRFIGVGDPNQAIYGFRGAAADGMDRFVAEFNAHMLPLSVSYRCSRAIGTLVNTKIKDFSVHDNAPEGRVIEQGSFDETIFDRTDAILCRNTLPLVTLAYKFIRKRLACKILGREIGEGLITLIKLMNTTDVDKLEEKLITYRTREVEKALAKNQESAAQAIEDKVNCVLVFVTQLPEGQRTIQKLTDIITDLFTNNSDSDVLTMCTIHKAKGLEWHRVFLLDPQLMPSKFAKRPWELVQEGNMWYVAITRAKDTLVYLRSEEWSGEKDRPRVKDQVRSAREALLAED